VGLSQTEMAELRNMHRSIAKWGTPELNYADSGLWTFLDGVWTKDEHDHRSPIKKIPWRHKEHLGVLFYHFLCCPILAIPKSRQVMVSWAMAAFAAWYVRTAAARLIVWQSKKDKDAHKMVSMGRDTPTAGRIDFIEQHLPRWLRDPNIMQGPGNRTGMLLYNPRSHDESGMKIHWHGGIIEAVPQGAGQVRSKTPGLYISDEAAFQEEFDEAVIALLPAVHGGGRFIAVSSIEGGSHFNNMVLEGMDHQTHEVTAGTPWNTVGKMPEDKHLPHGMRYRETPSGLSVLEIHYTADAAKDPARKGAQWLVDYSKGYIGGMESTGWQTEMEINYAAKGGDPCFPFLTSPASPARSAIYRKGPLEETVIKKMKLIAGYDYGTTNPSSFTVWGFDEAGTPWAVWELYEPCRNLKLHVAKIKACPFYDYLDYIVADPSIGASTQHARDASGLKTIRELFKEQGINMRLGRRGQDVTLVMRWLSTYWADSENPLMFITHKCPNLWSEIIGLRWDKHRSSAVTAYKNNPERIMQKNNHAIDASALVFDSKPGLPNFNFRRDNTFTLDMAVAEAEQRDKLLHQNREYVRASNY